ncbi:MAG: hypothetical protein WDW36_009729 [Sanguina aurantia]
MYHREVCRAWGSPLPGKEAEPDTRPTSPAAARPLVLLGLALLEWRGGELACEDACFDSTDTLHTALSLSPIPTLNPSCVLPGGGSSRGVVPLCTAHAQLSQLRRAVPPGGGTAEATGCWTVWEEVERSLHWLAAATAEVGGHTGAGMRRLAEGGTRDTDGNGSEAPRPVTNR